MNFEQINKYLSLNTLLTKVPTKLNICIVVIVLYIFIYIIITTYFMNII